VKLGAISPCDLATAPASLPAFIRAAGGVRLDFAPVGSRTQAMRIAESGGYRARFPRSEECEAVLINTGGGMAGGDRLAIDISLAAGAEAVVTTQAAEKIYRADDKPTTIAVSLDLGPESRLAWLPQETILFEGCRLRRRLSADLHSGARLLASEMLVFGRLARGERLQEAHLHEAWDVRVNDRLVWAERFGLRPPNAELLDEPALMDGARALATMVFVAGEAQARLQDARDRMSIEKGVRGGVTSVNGLLVGRLMGADPAAVRRSLAGTLAAWRGALLGECARLPRLWAI
jgi:urease accessory protein